MLWHSAPPPPWKAIPTLLLVMLWQSAAPGRLHTLLLVMLWQSAAPGRLHTLLLVMLWQSAAPGRFTLLLVMLWQSAAPGRFSDLSVWSRQWRHTSSDTWLISSTFDDLELISHVRPALWLLLLHNWRQDIRTLVMQNIQKPLLYKTTSTIDYLAYAFRVFVTCTFSQPFNFRVFSWRLFQTIHYFLPGKINC